MIPSATESIHPKRKSWRKENMSVARLNMKRRKPSWTIFMSSKLFSGKMQEEHHSTETHCQQEVHRQELNMKMKKIEELNEIIGKAFKWFPIMREMLQMEKFCKSAGFTQEMIDVLLAKRKPIVCSGKLYSTQHRQSFKIKDAVCKIEDDLTEEHKLVLTINRQPIVHWFKEQWEKLQQNLLYTVQREQKNRGFRM